MLQNVALSISLLLYHKPKTKVPHTAHFSLSSRKLSFELTCFLISFFSRSFTLSKPFVLRSCAVFLPDKINIKPVPKRKCSAGWGEGTSPLCLGGFVYILGYDSRFDSYRPSSALLLLIVSFRLSAVAAAAPSRPKDVLGLPGRWTTVCRPCFILSVCLVLCFTIPQCVYFFLQRDNTDG